MEHATYVDVPFSSQEGSKSGEESQETIIQRSQEATEKRGVAARSGALSDTRCDFLGGLSIVIGESQPNSPCGPNRSWLRTEIVPTRRSHEWELTAMARFLPSWVSQISV